MTSAMPTGGVDGSDPAAGDTGGADSASPAAGGWMPPFKIGQGAPGVFTDARGYIAGEPVVISAQNVNDAGVQASAALQTSLDAAGMVPGSGTTDSGPAADSMPTGGAGPAPKATSNAQRQANIDEAKREFPGYKG